MSYPSSGIVNFQKIGENLRKYYFLWLVPTIAGTALAMSYAGVKSKKWKATQAVLLRDEGSDNVQQPLGRFANPEALKLAQETIVQTAKNAHVIEAALRELGPDGPAGALWPSKAEVEETIGKIVIGPPKGSEFGKSDMLYISAEAKSPERAEALNSAVVKQLERRLQEIRSQRAKSLISEYTQAVELAEAELKTATAKLENLEREVGADIGELRSLTEGASGNSNLRESLNHIKERLRTERAKHDQNQQLISILENAQQDPDRLVEAPARIFDLNPALKKMKEGLIDAQIKAAGLQGTKTATHPEVIAAREIETAVKRELTIELDTTITGLASDKAVSQNEIDNLNGELQRVEAKLNALAALRAPYANIQAEVKQRNELLFKAQKGLSDSNASLAGAFNTSVLIKQDQPDAGISPVGPAATMIVAGGFAGGLLLGFGLVFITVPIGAACGRRWNDFVNAGRRASDQTARQTTPVVAPTRRSTDPVGTSSRATDTATNRRAEDGKSPPELAKNSVE